MNNGATIAITASKRKPKRIRRKCAHEGCDNRVVQGGVCVTHGAKRKLCSFPNCDKAVKLAGYCSTHGPSRRKCGTVGCTRVAVQGGHCLTHGARRRLCCYPGLVEGDKGGGASGVEQCQKNAVMGGMCKRHYDRMKDAERMLMMSLCMPVMNSSRDNSSSGEGDAVFPQQQQQQYGWRDSFSGKLKSEGIGGLGKEADLTATSILSPTIDDSQVRKSSLSIPVLPLSPIKNNGTKIIYQVSRQQTHAKPSQKSGLSSSDALTINEIISSGAKNRAHEVELPAFSPPMHPKVLLASFAPAEVSASPSFSPPSGVLTSFNTGALLSIKTPTTQLSFDAVNDTSRRRRVGSSSNNRPSSSSNFDHLPCTGISSCSCKACRSPTLAIYEQMIDPNVDKYAGLSPPELSGEASSRSCCSTHKSSGRMMAHSSDILTLTNNNCLSEEEPATSGSGSGSGSVVQKVSSDKTVREDQIREEIVGVLGREATGGLGGELTYLANTLPQQEVDDFDVSRAASRDTILSPKSSAYDRHYPLSYDLFSHRSHSDATFQNQQRLKYHHPREHPLTSFSQYHQGQGHANPRCYCQGFPPRTLLTPQLYAHQDNAADGHSVPCPSSAPAATLVHSHYSQDQQQQQHRLLPRQRENFGPMFIPKND